MLTIYDAVDGVLIKREGGASVSPATVWIDLLNPTKDEDLQTERGLGISVPTREEMSEIEASSRLYQEGGGHYMTAIILHQPDMHNELPPVATPVTFILSGHRLITVRYAEPRAIQIFLNRAQKKDAACMSGSAVLVGLLEAIIDREADRVERIQGEVDKLSQIIFDVDNGQQTMRTRRFDINIRTIGREGESELVAPTWGSRRIFCPAASGACSPSTCRRTSSRPTRTRGRSSPTARARASRCA